MTVEPRTLQTDAEKAIVENFERVVATLPGGADVRARREAAFDTFRRALAASAPGRPEREDA
jgi:hypothetical protein